MRRTAWALVTLAAVLAVFADIGVAESACGDAPAPGVNWQRCLLDNAKLGQHNLEGAILREAFFSGADLSGADLKGVDARRARFMTANLQGANLENARL